MPGVLYDVGPREAVKYQDMYVLLPTIKLCPEVIPSPIFYPRSLGFRCRTHALGRVLSFPASHILPSDGYLIQ